MTQDRPDKSHTLIEQEHQALRHAWQWIREQEVFVLFGVLLVVGALWGFAELADEVLEGSTRAADEHILLALRNPADQSDPLGPSWVEEAGRDFTALGGTAVLVLVVFATCAYLLLIQNPRSALFVLIAVGGGVVLSLLLKSGFDRPRPDLVPHGSHVYTASFPSGHSMLSAVTYLTLGALLARTQTRRRAKFFFIGLALLITFLVGISRVYLAVHWPTDVLAGWTLGAAWALLCWLAVRWIEHWRQHRIVGP